MINDNNIFVLQIIFLFIFGFLFINQMRRLLLVKLLIKEIGEEVMIVVQAALAVIRLQVVIILVILYFGVGYYKCRKSNSFDAIYTDSDSDSSSSDGSDAVQPRN